MIGARLRGQFKISRQERRPKFGNKFLHRIAFVTPRFPAKITIKAARVLGPVSQFMGKGGVIGFSIAEGFKGRHLHPVCACGIESLIAAVPDFRAGRGKERFSAGIARDRIEGRGLHRVKMGGQSVHLFGIKDGVALHKRDIPLVFLAGRLVGFGAADRVGIND